MVKKTALGVAKRQAKMDGWKNVLTGLGVKGKDRRIASKIEWSPMMEEEADELYAASDVARKIIDEVVSDAFREGYELKSDDLTPELIALIEDENQRLSLDEKVQEAWKLARMYGGSAIIPIPRDVELLAKPFIPESIAEIFSLLVLSRWELPRELLELDVRSKNFNNPKVYRICPRSGAGQMNFQVHHSWLIRFDGAYLPRIKFMENNLWHDSILNTCKIAIRDYDAALAAISATLDDFSVAVMKVKNLTQSIAEDRDDLIVKRLEIANLGRSIAKTIILDSESEEYEYQDRQLSGVADVAKLIAGRLVVASNMPHTKILGESPDGSNATGNSTTKDWYDHVAAQQENYLDQRLMKLWKWVLSAKKSPTSGVVPKGLKAIYAPLWQEPESVQATMRYQQAQTDQIYIANAVVEPAEIAVSRFGSGEYSTETQLVDDRKAAVKQTVKDLKNPKSKDEIDAQSLAVAKAKAPPAFGDKEDPSGKGGKKPDPKDKGAKGKPAKK